MPTKVAESEAEAEADARPKWVWAIYEIKFC